jgi:hypothetical protein
MAMAGPFHGNPMLRNDDIETTYRKFRRNATLQQVNLPRQRLAW